MDKSKTVAFTGHRKLNTDTAALAGRLDEVVRECHGRGYRYFMTDLTPEFSLLAAEAILRQRTVCSGLSMLAVIPFPCQSNLFADMEKRRYGSARLGADHEELLSRHYFRGCFHRGYDYMVDNASCLVTWYDDRPCGGTFYAVTRARDKRVSIRNLAQAERLTYRITEDGVNIADRNRGENGRNKPVAHISYDRDITFRDASLSLTARAQIEHFALWGNVHYPDRQGRLALRPIQP